MVTEHGSGPPRALLLDAMGTLLRLEPPVPRLAAGLEAAGHPNPRDAVHAALRAEIAHYRRHMHRGGDPAGLAALRGECAEVLARHLPDPPPHGTLLELLLDAIRFAPYPDALDLLDRADAEGIPVVVVSNFDRALPEHLEALGLLGRFAGVLASAVVGSAKPDRGIFAAALEAAGCPPHAALHCGDDPVCDLHGAGRAGIRAVLLDREGRFPREAPRIGLLTELPAVWG